DPASWRSLEIDRTLRSGGTEGTLLAAIDKTSTSAGGRLLRQWLRTPLRDLEHITARQNAIAAFLASPTTLKGVAEKLDDVCDIERIIGRLAVNRVGPRDLASLSRCLGSLPALLELLASMPQSADVAPELVNLRDFCKER